MGKANVALCLEPRVPLLWKMSTAYLGDYIQEELELSAKDGSQMHASHIVGLISRLMTLDLAFYVGQTLGGRRPTCVPQFTTYRLVTLEDCVPPGNAGTESKGKYARIVGESGWMESLDSVVCRVARPEGIWVVPCLEVVREDVKVDKTSWC